MSRRNERRVGASQADVVTSRGGYRRWLFFGWAAWLVTVATPVSGQVFVDPTDATDQSDTAEPQHDAPETPVTSAAAKHRRRRAEPESCSEGRARSEDTSGHCCWQGQVWSKRECRGVPLSCPVGYEIDGAKEQCAPKSCAIGEQRVDGVHCCFPGQVWSSGRSMCVGVPVCPDGFEVHNESCVALAPFHKAVGVNTAYGTRLSIPSGEFVMGCKKDVDANCDLDEKPFNTVWLDAFEIDRTEVPVSAYARCADAAVCTSPAVASACNWGVAGRDEHPVNCVSWAQANAFCVWVGGRLPTEAEWEKTARGITPQLYPWGSQQASCDRAVVDGCGGMLPIGSTTAGVSPFGALDMAGNVAEWTADWYSTDTYRDTLEPNPTGPDSGTSRVVRGGGHMDGPHFVRTSDRHGIDPAKAQRDLGFRCAWTSY